MSIAHQLINIFNSKFKDIDTNDNLNELESFNDKNIKKYKQLLFPMKESIKPTFIDDPVLDTPSYSNPQCNYICKMEYINNISFVKKIMELRILEIRKKLVSIKYIIELYKLTLISIKNLKGKRKQEEVNKLELNKIQLLLLLKNNIIQNGEYIIQTTIHKYLFLKNQYELLIDKTLKKKNKYFIY
jgi:hypothetical protein